MSKDPYNEAKNKKTVLNQRLDKIRAEMKEIEREIAKLDSFIDTWHTLTGTGGEHPTPRPQKTPNPKNPPREVVGDLADEILVKAGRPMPRRELFEAIKARGLTIYGKDPEMVFSTMMWRMQDRFVRLKKHGYWVVRLPCKDYGYDPSVTLMDDLIA